jgi:hypothetical protein
VLNIRESFSDKPRFHVFLDMDFQPKKKAQQQTTVFADGRTMRPQVVGTVGRGQLEEQDAFYLGYDPNALAATSWLTPAKLVSVQDGTVQPPAEVPATEQSAKPAEVPATEQSAKPAEVPATEQSAKQDEAKPAETNAQAPVSEPAVIVQLVTGMQALEMDWFTRELMR